MFTPAAEARRDVGLLYAGKIENWLPYPQLVTRLEMIPKRMAGILLKLCVGNRCSPRACTYFLSLCHAFIQPVEFCSRMLQQ